MYCSYIFTYRHTHNKLFCSEQTTIRRINFFFVFFSFKFNRNGDTVLMRKHCLSLVVPFVSFSELQRHLPRISSYYYKEATIMTKTFGFDKLSKQEIKRIRYDRKKVSSFISFITSPHIVSELPYGTSTVTLSSGAKMKIPNMMRSMINERIVAQYSKFLEKNSQPDLAMSRFSHDELLHSFNQEICAWYRLYFLQRNGVSR